MAGDEGAEAEAALGVAHRIQAGGFHRQARQIHIRHHRRRLFVLVNGRVIVRRLQGVVGIDFCAQPDRGHGDKAHQRRGPASALGILRGIAEDATGRALHEPQSYLLGQLPIHVAIGMRHLVFALQRSAKERMGPCHRRPTAIVRTQKPQCIEGKTGGLKRAQYLHRCIARLGRENRLAGLLFEYIEELFIRYFAVIEGQCSHGVQQLRPPGLHLVVFAG